MHCYHLQQARYVFASHGRNSCRYRIYISQSFFSASHIWRTSYHLSIQITSLITGAGLWSTSRDHVTSDGKRDKNSVTVTTTIQKSPNGMVYFINIGYILYGSHCPLFRLRIVIQNHFVMDTCCIILTIPLNNPEYVENPCHIMIYATLVFIQ